MWATKIYYDEHSGKVALQNWLNSMIKDGVSGQKTQSLGNYKTAGYQIYVEEEIQRQKATCEYLPKQYDKVFTFYYIYARNRWEIYDTLMRLLYDSGIRLFWLQIQKRAVEKVRATSKPSDITAVKLNDHRTLTLFGIVCAGLAISMFGLLYENYIYTGKSFINRRDNWVEYFKKTYAAIFLMFRVEKQRKELRTKDVCQETKILSISKVYIPAEESTV